MKNIFKILGVFFVALIAFACEPDEYAVPDIDFVSVYNITETGNNSIFEINVYRKKALLIISTNKGKLTSYNTTAYSDTSDDLNYIVNVTAIEKKTVTDAEGVQTIETLNHAYAILADKVTGSCSITVTTTNADATPVVDTYNGVLAEKEVYN